jgi:NADP-dependent 3-hydroxy acid dehydrogenase YdfG
VSHAGRRIAVVTGASGGIGRAIAAALAAQGLSLCLTGRDAERLRGVADVLPSGGPRPTVVPADLGSDAGIRALVAAVEALGRADVLVHCAGALRLADITASGWDDLDELYRVNLRAPYLVTKSLLPLLRESQGQIVFVNSSAGLRGGAENVLYAATKSALRSLADGIRDSVNASGVRVLSVFPGRTDTPMQERVRAFEEKSYDAEILLQPGDVAAVVVHALMLPRTAEATEIMVRPMRKSSDARRSP